jgi:hypothetical protein
MVEGSIDSLDEDEELLVISVEGPGERLLVIRNIGPLNQLASHLA